MRKGKIAISVNKNLLDIIDSKVDGSVIRSRSQAIEFYLRKGLKDESIDTAVILLKGEHQQIALRSIAGKSLVMSQLNFLAENGIANAYIVTQHTNDIGNLQKELSKSKISVEIVKKDAKGNASALFAVRDKITSDFVAMSGDVYNNFSLRRMVEKHKSSNRIATIGLMSREKASEYGNVILDGDLVIEFIEKPKRTESNVVNAGIYIFKPEIFSMFSQAAVSLERDVFPILAKQRQLLGFFTHGEYRHII